MEIMIDEIAQRQIPDYGQPQVCITVPTFPAWLGTSAKILMQSLQQSLADSLDSACTTARQARVIWHSHVDKMGPFNREGITLPACLVAACLVAESFGCPTVRAV